MSDKVTSLITLLFQNTRGENKADKLEQASYSETGPCH